jgi:MEKHLA domain
MHQGAFMLSPWESPAVIHHTQCLLNSYRHWFSQDLLADPIPEPETGAHQLFCAPFVVLSHGTQADPILNYGNQMALDLWEMAWPDFTQMPSRLTAEPDLREVRSQLLATAAQQGYLTGYKGVRISKTSQRFFIQNATIWRVLDDEGNICGQAATFESWEPLV